MVLIYIGITIGVAVLAWSKGYNTGRAEGYSWGQRTQTLLRQVK